MKEFLIEAFTWILAISINVLLPMYAVIKSRQHQENCLDVGE